jgi:hypothetical protein
VRAVLVHFSNATEEDVARFLKSTFPSQQGPPWICDVNGDPCLWIDFYRDGPSELEQADLAELSLALGRHPRTSVVAELSGRYDGAEQVRNFVTTLLAQFSGVAHDDCTEHYWTGAEVLNGYRGQQFFDYLP